MPYKLYTTSNVSKRHCLVEEALQVFRDDDKADQIPHFEKNLEKLDLVHEGAFDIMVYARYYCEKDTEVFLEETWLKTFQKIGPPRAGFFFISVLLRCSIRGAGRTVNVAPHKINCAETASYRCRANKMTIPS